MVPRAQATEAGQPPNWLASHFNMTRATKEQIAKLALQEQCNELADVLPMNRMIHSRDVKRRRDAYPKPQTPEPKPKGLQ